MLSKQSLSIPLLLCYYLADVVTANCKTFMPEAGITDYYEAYYFPQQTSVAITCDNATYNGMLCPNGDGCSLPSNGTFRLLGQLNTSTSVSFQDAFALYRTVSNAMRQFGRASLSYSDGCYDPNGGVSQCIPNNVSAYATLSPQGACVNGTFSGCSGDSPVSDGTALNVCGYLEAQRGNLQSAYVNISASLVPECQTLSTDCPVSNLAAFGKGDVPSWQFLFAAAGTALFLFGGLKLF